MDDDDRRVEGELHDMEVTRLETRIRELEQKLAGPVYTLKAAIIVNDVPRIILNNEHVGDVEILVVDGVLTFRRAT